jgi:hypothetical protein
MLLSRKGELLYCFFFEILHCTWWRLRDGYFILILGLMDRCKLVLGLGSEKCSTVEQNNFLFSFCLHLACHLVRNSCSLCIV